MNSIPIIFNERHIVYTTLGGTEAPLNVLMPVTCVVIGKSSRETRARAFKNLVSKGFEKIISVEKSKEDFYSDDLPKYFPSVRFIVTGEDVTEGDLINIGMAEAASPYVLVVREECAVFDFNFSFQMAKCFAQKNQLCVAPKIFFESKNPMAVVFTPSVDYSKFDVCEEFSFFEDKKTLYAADSSGFYDREKFIQLGGFDYTIKSAYWQRLDFFMRAWLWGEKVTLSSALSFNYDGTFDIFDKTVDISYLLFYLKNLMPVFKSDHAEISKSSFFTFKSRSSCGIAEAVKLFKLARAWTKENQYRFKCDAVSLIQNWSA